MDSLRGGAYRWEHGAAYQLQPGDTLESLRTGEWNEGATLYEAVLRGYDDSRPLLHQYNGHVIRSLAEHATT